MNNKYGPYSESDFYCPYKGDICEGYGLAIYGGWQARTEVEALKAQVVKMQAVVEAVCKYRIIGCDRGNGGGREWTCRHPENVPPHSSWGECCKGKCPYIKESTL